MVVLSLSCSPSDPSVRHWDRLFDSSPIKGEDIWLCCLVVCPALHLWIADQVRNDVTIRCMTVPHPVDVAAFLLEPGDVLPYYFSGVCAFELG